MTLPLAFHELSYVPEGDEVLIGRVDTGEFVVLPAEGAALLQQMVAGVTPAEAAEWFERTYDEPVDVDDFVDTVRQLGFVRDTSAEPVPLPALARFRRLGQSVFSWPSAVILLTMVAVALLINLTRPDIRPHSSQIFFTGSLVLVQLVITVSQVPLLYLHEGAHLLAGQRLGLNGRLTVSNRLTYIVFETKLNSLLSLPRRQRYLPFLAGTLVDILALAVLEVIAELSRGPSGHLSMAGKIALALGFTVAMRIGWQLQLYLRTDLYYVFATYLNCYDLHEASKALLWNRLWRLLGKTDRLVDESQWTPHDQRAGRWYGPFIVLGVATFVGLTIVGSLPVVVRYFGLAFRHLTTSPMHAPFWDALISMGFNVGQLVLLIWLSRRKRRESKLRAPRLLSS